MKRFILLLSAAVLVFSFCACGKKGVDSAQQKDSGEISGEITVVSREEGSGTRDAFTELAGIVDENKNDLTYDGAEITNSTSVMLTTVSGNKKAIGYVSLGSLSNDVKALSIDGNKPTVENIKSGAYKIARPFNICYKDGSLSDLAKDFRAYILSEDGQKIIEKEGYIRNDDASAYSASGLKGKLALAGSTSVAPVMEVLADEYKKLNPDVTIEIQQSGSSAGISSAIEGVCDFGMSSRDLKDSEKAELVQEKIAMDGIAVIVNNANTIKDITIDNVKAVFTGDITDWSEVK